MALNLSLRSHPTPSARQTRRSLPTDACDTQHRETLDLTVVIPTFNGSDRLLYVIDHLRQQQHLDGIRWEILIVDNNSSDATQTTVEALQAGWTQAEWGISNVPLRYCFEPRQGLAFGRQHAMEEAAGRWVGFLDDDNWPDTDWVFQAHRFSQSHPSVAAFGSCIRAQYDSTPPLELRQLEAFLAIRDYGETTDPFHPEALQLPPGAGLVVNRQQWLDAVPARLGFTGRVGQQMISGEDYAALLYLHRAGGTIAYNPAMKIRHWIPAKRLETDALLRLAYGIGLATCKLRWINANPIQRVVLALKTGAGGVKRFMQQLTHWEKTEAGDTIRRFQLAFHLGSAFSPLFALSPRLAAWLNHDRAQTLTQGILTLRQWFSQSNPETTSDIQATL